ncbi:MAG: LytTR family DNA-binding domain-containing protein [Bacteroidota bacterium]
MIRAIIIEDEIKGRNNLKNLLAQYCDNVRVIDEADSVEAGLRLIDESHTEIDLAFLDINLPDGLVFQMLDQLERIDFEIIFATGYEQHAIEACNYASIGYITKPIDPDKLKEAVSRVRLGKENRIEERYQVFRGNYTNPNAFEKMSISAVDGIYFVNFKDIVRLEAEDNYTHIYLKGGEKITASKTIKSYEDMLASVNFYRVHKRHVINLNFMRKFVKGDGGYLVMDDGMQIEVSRRRRPAFMEQMRRLQEGI